MPYYWMKLADGTEGTVQAATEEEALEIPTTMQVLGTLPYPASPVIHKNDDCPPFCIQPEKCLNRGSCPRNRACDD